MADKTFQLDAWECADLVREGEIKAVELLDIALERIGRHDAELNSFALLDPDGARERALEIDAIVASGQDPGPLAGIPVGVKDLENVAGLPTRKGSLLLTQPAPHDSTQVERLRKSGAVVIGKTTTPEMGSLSFTSSKVSGTTRNPWDLARTPGGSSGGSAAAVAAGLIPMATGSDGGGSIRIPSSYSGLPGLKVTYGLVARGPGRLASAHLSTYGPMARSVRDIARALDQVTGPHPMDPFSLPKTTHSYEGMLEELELTGKKAVWSSTLGFGVCDNEVRTIVETVAGKLVSAAGLEQIDTPVDLPDAGTAWSAPFAVDCYSELEPFWPDRADEMTPVVAMAMQLAENLQAGQLSESARLRFEVLSKINSVFDHADFIITPTTPTTAFNAEGPMPHEINGRPLAHPLLAICFTFPFNLSGHPAISIPAGFDSNGLPVGLQVVGRRMTEPDLLALARLMELEHPWPKMATSYS